MIAGISEYAVKPAVWGAACLVIALVWAIAWPAARVSARRGGSSGAGAARALALVALVFYLMFTGILSAAPRAASSIAEVNGARLYYEEKGSGLPVVLIHGGNLDSRMWDPQFARFAREFRVIRYDVRPYGRSSHTAPESSVEDLRGLLDRLRIHRAAIVGLSLGGRIAIDFALAYPGRVRSLVLVGPGLTGFSWSPDPASAELMAAAMCGDARRAMELWLQHPYMAPAMRRPDLAPTIRRLTTDNAHIWRIRQGDEQVSAPPAIGRLGEIHARTLLVVGALDVPDIHAIVRLLGEGIAGARTVTIRGAGHIVNMEEPKRFNDAVLAFLRAVAAAPTPTAHQ